MNERSETYLTADDIAALDAPHRRGLLNDLAGFRSGCLVGTVGPAGVPNLAVFNSVVHIGAKPWLLGLVVRPLTVPRHTYDNLRATGFFTLNHIGTDFVAAAHQTSANYPAEVSEFAASGLTPVFGTRHAAPYVKESAVRMGLALEEKHEIRANGTWLVVGRVIEAFFPTDCWRADGSFDLVRAGSAAISGLDGYYAPQRLARFAYARPDVPPTPTAD